MNAHIIEKPSPETLCNLDRIFGYTSGDIRPFKAELLQSFKQEHISAYCVHRGIYGIFTHELIDLIQSLINGRTCLEVGAGAGTLGRALGVPMYDNFMQEWPEIKSAYLSMKQTPIQYGRDVLKMDGLEAIRILRPQVVVGSWITHQYKAINHHLGGNEHGFNEHDMFNHGVQLYIMYGNKTVHHQKPLFNDKAYRVTQMIAPYFHSRSIYTGDNILYLVEKR